jgi:hypothetical protein
MAGFGTKPASDVRLKAGRRKRTVEVGHRGAAVTEREVRSVRLDGCCVPSADCYRERDECANNPRDPASSPSRLDPSAVNR